ncbi:MAG: winged helix family two component transcriptional regulator [Candidatus Nomurabacteria bacterium]|nr:winged helix family two component transcriptional regulator [Candidatus Nomurabacteria bacterium]
MGKVYSTLMKVLVVEDQIKLANSIKEGLENFGYAVDAVHDGTKALALLEFGYYNYDIVLLDIMLPGTDGIVICSTLRNKNIMIPIIMLTARDTVENKVSGLDAGADDYIIKPFSFEELVARIRALLRRPEIMVASELQCGDIVLNTLNHKITKRGVEVPLTLKEFAILEYFMLHANQVLSRDQILAHVWDHAYDAFSNIIDVHVKNLRKKLQNKNETIFETIHGVGYRFNA